MSHLLGKGTAKVPNSDVQKALADGFDPYKTYVTKLESYRSKLENCGDALLEAMDVHDTKELRRCADEILAHVKAIEDLDGIFVAATGQVPPHVKLSPSREAHNGTSRHGVLDAGVETK